MASDYLKQLQLTKQLEQKAKEATKSRKAAEDKIAEAEGSLSQATAMGIEAAAYQKAIADGHAAYAKRDYSAALAAAIKTIEGLGRQQGEKVAEVLDSAVGVLGLINEQGEDRQAVEGLVNGAQKLLAEGHPLDAFAEAKKAGEAAERYADLRMNAMFSKVQRLIDLAEERKLAVSAKKQVLAKAQRLHDEGDREGSLAKLGSCFKGLQESFSKLLEEQANSLLEMAGVAAETGGDISAITAQVEGARIALAEGRIEDSLAIMAEADKTIAPIITKAVEVRQAGQEERSNWLRTQGINITRYLTASRKTSDAAKAGNSEEALEWLRRAEKALRDNEAEVVMGRISNLRPRLLLARKMKADIGNVLSKLEEARQSTVYGKSREALELIGEASAELDDSLARFRELGDELERTKEVFLQARRMRAVSSEASAIVARSREGALAGNLKESVAGLAAARALLVRKVQDICARDLLNAELLVTTGWSIGAEVDGDSAVLDVVSQDLMEGTIDNIGRRLADVVGALEESLAATASEMLEEAGRMTEPSLGLSDLAPIRAKYEEARSLLSKKEWYRSCTLAEDVIDEAEKVQKASLDHLTVQASSLLEIGRRLGIESQTLNQKMADVEGGRESFTTSIRSINDVITYARSLIKDEVTRSLSQLMRSSGAARKNGVTTTQIDRMAEEASKALVAEDMDKSYNLLKEAEREMEKTIALHNEVYDLIVLLSRLTGEVRLPPESKVPQLLQETKRLFEAGRYDGARTSARNCYQEVEVLGAEVLAPRKLQEARDMVPVIQQLGFGIEQAQKAVNEAHALLQNGKYAEAMSTAKEARKRMVEVAGERIAVEISEIRTAMRDGGADTAESSAMAIVEKAESLLGDKRFSDALRAIRFAKGEVGQLLALRTAVGKELGRVEDTLREIESLGIEAREAKEVFEHAYQYRSSGRNNLVVEMARRALHTARVAADGRLNADLARIESQHRVGDLEGSDLKVLTQETKGVYLKKMEQHRYTEAMKALEIYQEGLRTLIALREQCATSLSKLAEDLVRVPQGSAVMEETKRLMALAQKAYVEGAFRECLGLTEECRASGAAAMQWHDRCSKRLEDITAGILVGEGRRYLDPEIAALMGSARKALEDGRYEDMDWALLKATRLHQRARATQSKRATAELINLLRMYRSVELGAEDLPTEVSSLLDLRLTDVGEVRNLSEITGAVRGRLKKGIGSRITAVRERAEQSKGEMSISLSLLSVAERSLAEEKLEQAVELIQDAEQAMGASRNDVRELRAQSHRYHELLQVAESLGIEGDHHRELYRQALRSRDVPAAVHRLKEAVSALERSTSACLPNLEIRSSALFNRGSSPAVQIKMNADGSPTLATVLWPHQETTLPKELLAKGRMALSYRALFLPRPFVTMLEPTG